MSRAGLNVARADVPSINTEFELIDGRIQNLTDAGKLPDSAISYATETANYVLAAPDAATATKGTPSFRALTSTDIPNLDASKITTGQLALARGGTHADLSGTGGANQVLTQSSAGANITVGTLDAASIAAGKIALARGGTNADLSGTGGTSKFLAQASAGTAITVVQPATTDLSDWTAWTTFTPSLTAGTGTWTLGTTVDARYMIIGKTMMFSIYITGNSNSNITTTLKITIPGSKTAAQNQALGPVSALDNGTVTVGFARTNSAGTTIDIYKDIGATTNWAVSAATNSVGFTAAIEIS